MVIKNIEIRPKGNGTYPDVLYPRTSIAQVDGLQGALDTKSATTHTHTTAQVTGLDTALAGKAPTTHTHTTAQVTGLDTALAGKAPVSHTHAGTDITQASTTVRGTVQLSTATNSTSTTLASTASAVKSAYDLANSAFQSASDGKTQVATAITGKGVTASGSDTFSVLSTKIGQISTGKKFASGTITSSSTRLTFPSSVNGASMEYYVNVTGLTFVPSVILLKRSANDFSRVVYDSRITSYPILFETPTYFPITANVIINATTFQLPCPINSTLMDWVAYE